MKTGILFNNLRAPRAEDASLNDEYAQQVCFSEIVYRLVVLNLNKSQ